MALFRTALEVAYPAPAPPIPAPAQPGLRPEPDPAPGLMGNQGPAQPLPRADTEAPACFHALMIAVLRMRMQRDKRAPLFFRARGLLQSLRQYPYPQPVGPLPGPLQGLAGLTLEGVTDKTWPWEMQFLTDLLAWLGALMWADEVGTVSFL